MFCQATCLQYWWDTSCWSAYDVVIIATPHHKLPQEVSLTSTGTCTQILQMTWKCVGEPGQLEHTFWEILCLCLCEEQPITFLDMVISLCNNQWRMRMLPYSSALEQCINSTDTCSPNVGSIYPIQIYISIYLLLTSDERCLNTFRNNFTIIHGGWWCWFAI